MLCHQKFNTVQFHRFVLFIFMFFSIKCWHTFILVLSVSIVLIPRFSLCLPQSRQNSISTVKSASPGTVSPEYNSHDMLEACWERKCTTKVLPKSKEEEFVRRTAVACYPSDYSRVQHFHRHCSHTIRPHPRVPEIAVLCVALWSWSLVNLCQEIKKTSLFSRNPSPESTWLKSA